MKLPSLFVMLMTLVVTMMVGSAFIVIDVLIYLYVVFAAMVLMGAALAMRFKLFSLSTALAAAFMLSGPLILSAALNNGTLTDITPPLALVVLVFLAIGFGANSSDEEITQIMAAGAVLSVVCFIFASVSNGWNVIGSAVAGTRMLVPGMHPNLFALIAMTIFLLVASSRNVFLVGPVFAIAFVACLASSSRSALLTMLVVLVASRLLLLRKTGGSVALLALGCFAFAILLIFSGSLLNGIADQIFHVNDQYRGVSSGGSGRTVVWEHYIENWQQHPLIGTGPGTVYELAGRSYYSHNIVLQLLTDAGVIGLVAFGLFLVWVLRAARSAAVSPELRRMVYLLILAYLVYGLFEGRAVNLGNPLSALFFTMCVAVIGRAATHRAPKVRPALAPAQMAA